MSNKKILSLAISGMLLISSSFSLEAKGMDKLSLNSTVGTNFIKNHKKAIIGTAVGALITSVITFVAVSAVKKTENINCNENDKKSDFKIQVSRHNNNKSTSESQSKKQDENIEAKPVKGTSLEKITEEIGQVYEDDTRYDTSEASDEDIFFSAEEWSCEEEIEKDTDQVHEDNVSHDTGENSGESLMLIDEAINEKFDQMFQKNGKTELFSICPIV